MLGLGLGLVRGVRPLGGFVGLLDLFPNAAAAYSLRLLRKNYSGGLTRVRAWDGVANQGEAEIMPRRIDAQNYVVDLNSKLEDLDATAISRGLTTNDTLADLVLSGTSNYDGLISAWRDQSLSNDATQTTAANQPKIVNAGSLVTEKGKAAIDFDGVDDFISLPSALANLFQGQGKAISAFNVTSVVSGNRTLWSITDPSGSNDNYYFSSHNVNFNFFARGSGGALKTGVSSNTFAAGQYIKTDILPDEFGGIQNGDMYVDSVQEVSSFDYSTATKTLTGGGIGALVRSSISAYFNGNHQEIILYPSDQSTNRTAIETNVKNFWGI